MYQYHLGLVYGALGDTAKAKQSLERALALGLGGPNAESARKTLSEKKG
jgi:hypothetical protein